MSSDILDYTVAKGILQATITVPVDEGGLMSSDILHYIGVRGILQMSNISAVYKAWLPELQHEVGLIIGLLSPRLWSSFCCLHLLSSTSNDACTFSTLSKA